MQLRHASWIVLTFAVAGGLFLLLNLFVVAGLTTPQSAGVGRSPFVLISVMALIVIALAGAVLIFRRAWRPYRRLVGEAERAIGAKSPARNEAEFVLETFQAVVGQLQAQQSELERLGANATARAASAEKFSERILASVPTGLIAFDSSGCATVLNEPAMKLLDVDGSAEGKHVDELLESIPALAAIVQNCLESGETYRREETTTRTPGGRPRRFGATVAPIDPGSEHGARGALCLITDITEVSELREQLALKKNLESLGEMSAGLSHEFKNALATIQGYAQLLQNLEQDERGRGAATALLLEVRNLSEMVTSFLNFARPQPLIKGKVDLEELIKDCLIELQPLFEQRRVESLVEGEFSEVTADERMLRQAVLNLLRNAAEAIEEAAEQRVVKVQSLIESDFSDRKWARLEITDSGSGIPEADLQRIFIPFFTTKTKGHGVGLALAQRVVLDHGGSLTARNLQGGGALFTIRLPLSGT